MSDPSVGTALKTPPPGGPAGPADEIRLSDSRTRLDNEEETRLSPDTNPDDVDETHIQAGSGGRRASVNTGPLTVGQNFGPRYHIIRCVGAGGMGAVYQAWDQELEIAVAVKVIRPDAIADRGQAEELERRFKRELVLARKVTHKNVVRIHDIGEIEGVKYITMPYVQGSDLATILKSEHRLPLDRALMVGRQIVEGLVAAHEAGVVHRDLKPANIMLNAEDHACIMDFGIARSTSAATGFAMTVAGAVIGTVEYMAPEQARGEAVDQRADVYAFGLILRDMLLGGRHAGNTTGVAELMARMQNAPAPLRSVDPGIPEGVDALVSRCLQPNPADRYQTSAELLKELDRVASGGRPSAGPWYRRVRPEYLAGAAALVVALVGGGYFVWSGGGDRPASAALPTRTVTLGVLPFRNLTSDSSLNSLGPSLSQVLATNLGEAGNIRPVPPQRIREILDDLRFERNANFGPADLKRIANFANADTVLWGTYYTFGAEIIIEARLLDIQKGESTVLQASAPNAGALLSTVATLTADVQRYLAGGSEDVLKQLQATAWRPSTQSVTALTLYDEGLQLARQGDHQAAQKQFELAIEEDRNFALAISALAKNYADQGYDSQAQQYSRRALSLSEAMPAGQERYLIAAAHYRITDDPDKAIETYEQLVQLSPNNARIRYELGDLYEQMGVLDKAQEHYGKAVELDPKHVASQTAVGRVHIRRGDAQAALDPLNRALSLAVELDNDQERATALHAIGIAYKRLGRPTDALRHYQQSLEIRRKLGQKGGMAASLSEIAQIQETMGQPHEAIKSHNEALSLHRETGNKTRTTLTLINLGALMNETLGRPDDGLKLLREALVLARDSGSRSSEALALNNIGSAYFAKGDYSEAQTNFERALEIRQQSKVNHEIADTQHSLGETLNRMGRFDQALKRYLAALQLRRQDSDRRNEAIESYSIGTVFDYQGRYGAAVGSKNEALQAFRDLKQRDFWLGEILSGHGASLALAGRLDESEKSLEEALTVARELKNEGLVAQILRIQSDRALYGGDTTAASKLAEQAAQSASRTSSRSLQLWAEAQVARAAAVAQPTRAVAATLANISRQANSSGSIYLSVLGSVESAETLLRLGDHRAARQEIDRALPRAETLGLRELLARSEYVLAETMRQAGDAQARRHYTTALRILEDMKGEDGAQRVLERADLKAIYAECKRWSTTT